MIGAAFEGCACRAAFHGGAVGWLRARGVHQARLAEDEGVLFAIRHMAVDWHQPARLDDLLDISVHSVNAGGTRLIFRQDMRRQADGELLAAAEVKAACPAPSPWKSEPIFSCRLSRPKNSPSFGATRISGADERWT